MGCIGALYSMEKVKSQALFEQSRRIVDMLVFPPKYRLMEGGRDISDARGLSNLDCTGTIYTFMVCSMEWK
jgi:hypothetical protein